MYNEYKYILSKYVPERTREVKLKERKDIRDMNFHEQKAAFKELFTNDIEEPYMDMNRLGIAMVIYNSTMEEQYEYPEECRKELTAKEKEMLLEVEHDIETYLKQDNLTWRNRFWEKREFLHKLSR